MSRRRPTDGEAAVAGDTLPPPVTSDPANGKHRSTTERATRFFRTRPVSSLLIIIALCLGAIITFTIGRAVGTILISFFQPGTIPSHLGSSSIASSLQNPLGIAADRPLNNTSQSSDSKNENDGKIDQDNDEADTDKEDDVGEDEKGALVDGVDEKNAPEPPPAKSLAEQVRNAEDKQRVRSCYRKFEPGKLGWPKTLCVTDEFFFDISVNNSPIGRMKIGVFGEVVPKSVANFRALATCTGVFSDEKLCYRGDSFHRVVTSFVAQGGSKATGRSIYGGTFKEEQSKDHHSFLQHSEKGVVSWAEYPIGSQFFIMVREEALYLDNNHVVFGVVTEGLDVLQRIHDAPRNGEEPIGRVLITNCGDAHSPV